MSERAPFIVGELDEIHEVGNRDCKVCWSAPYPHDGCPGLIHSAWGDEDTDCNFWLYTKCDVCGESA